MSEDRGESRELTTGEDREVAARPNMEPVFAGRQAIGLGGNVGAIAIEQERAIAEAQGKMVLAKRFPRSMAAAMEEFMVACADLNFASTAFYTVPNRGTGPSIRFAEEVARCYGNFDYGHRELSREAGDGTAANPGKSEIEVYAWDMEKNNFSRRQITVLHLRDKTGGATPLKDQTDIDNRVANVASKQMRGRILALTSKALVAAGVARCKATLAGNTKDTPIATQIMRMTGAFSKYGVTVAHLEGYLKHKIDDSTIDDLADLRGVYTALEDGAKVSEYFGAEAAEEDAFVKAAEPEPKPAAAKKPAEPKAAEPKAAAQAETAKPQEQEAAAAGQEAAPEPEAPAAATQAAAEPAQAAPAAAGGPAEGDMF